MNELFENYWKENWESLRGQPHSLNLAFKEVAQKAFEAGQNHPGHAVSPTQKAIDLLRLVDQAMQGDESYEHGWLNFPEKPEKSLAHYVREFLSGTTTATQEEKHATGHPGANARVPDTCPSCGSWLGVHRQKQSAGFICDNCKHIWTPQP